MPNPNRVLYHPRHDKMRCIPADTACYDLADTACIAEAESMGMEPLTPCSREDCGINSLHAHHDRHATYQQCDEPGEEHVRVPHYHPGYEVGFMRMRAVGYDYEPRHMLRMLSEMPDDPGLWRTACGRKIHPDDLLQNSVHWNNMRALAPDEGAN